MKKKKPKKVDILPPPMDTICYNRNCRRVLRGQFKILEYANGQQVHLCNRCFFIWIKQNQRFIQDESSEITKSRKLLGV